MWMTQTGITDVIDVKYGYVFNLHEHCNICRKFSYIE